MEQLEQIRAEMRQYTLARDEDLIVNLLKESPISASQRAAALHQAELWVRRLRDSGGSGLMDVFMAEYGLSNEEGVALMCLAEALLRVPDSSTMDALIEDKIVGSNWASHLGQSTSPLVNASTWALMLTGRVLDEDRPVAGVLHGLIKRLGEPVTRAAVNQAMRELGEQFVLGESISEAIDRGKRFREQGYLYSYDMLGEAALTAADAAHYFRAYLDAIRALADADANPDIRRRPGISIKLSALHERYEETQRARVMAELVPRVLDIALAARNAQLSLAVDAEEAARLELSMDIIQAVLANPALAGWDGFGIVVQAYGKRSRYVIDWFYQLAERLDRRVMLRLVKGAYWDTEIKRAQTDGLTGFPVFLNKSATDISYLENAAHLLKLTDRIYPQFATHNAHTVALIRELAGHNAAFEFQKLHGMGDALYEQVQKSGDYVCRIYAPVGEHEDLLAYLVRRLLENGANSSFVNQLLDEKVPIKEVIADPYEKYQPGTNTITLPENLYGTRKNSRGFDLSNRADIEQLEQMRAQFKNKLFEATSLTYVETSGDDWIDVHNPASREKIGRVAYASTLQAQAAVTNARLWDSETELRAAVLEKAADLFEANTGEILALLCREAGKTLADGIAELREAVDFLRYYAAQARLHQAGPRGTFLCISPWNFPLAIFTGQVAAALAAGNAVLAKPAESTCLIAHRTVQWLHEAGVPTQCLQLVLGTGTTVGSALSSHPDIDGVCFTGSTATAKLINTAMASNADPAAPLIAETGGLNAMIVDSTALPEQAVTDIVASAFQSAGQRCSALRLLCVQEDIADRVLDMLNGAMDALVIGDPWQFATDIGPLIDQTARDNIANTISEASKKHRILKTLSVPTTGHFLSPCVIELDAIEQLQQEVFGPVLHVYRYQATQLDAVIQRINHAGYGLTFGMHSRINHHVDLAIDGIRAGNIYINRNQIGAVVGSQPFGGEGLSGTGPKAGGPLYLHRFYRKLELKDLPRRQLMPGPTGESNEWTIHPRGVVLCIGPSGEQAKSQAEIVRTSGCEARICAGLKPIELAKQADIDMVVYWGTDAAPYRQALANREGPIIPLVVDHQFEPYCWLERHVCIDTTASGGNVELLSQGPA